MSAQRLPISFVATTEPDTARTFYCDVLGLTLLEQSLYALVFQDGETMLRVQIVSDLPAASHTAHGWQVQDIETEVMELTSRGVDFLNFEHLTQSETGIWTTTDGNKIAWFDDRCGNILSLTEFAQC